MTPSLPAAGYLAARTIWSVNATRMARPAIMARTMRVRVFTPRPRSGCTYGRIRTSVQPVRRARGSFGVSRQGLAAGEAFRRQVPEAELVLVQAPAEEVDDAVGAPCVEVEETG